MARPGPIWACLPCSIAHALCLHLKCTGKFIVTALVRRREVLREAI